MKRANGFHQRTPKWCWGLLALTVGLVLPGKEMIVTPGRAEADEQERTVDTTPKPPVAIKPKATPEAGVKVIPIKDGRAAEATSAISNFLMKKANGKKLSGVVVSMEKDSNTLRISRATPEELVEITRLVESLNVVAKQFFIPVAICEGKPMPTLREALKQDKVAILSRPRIMTLDNQTALVNIGRSVPRAPMPPLVESATLSAEGFILQITASSVNEKRVSLKMVCEISTVVDQQKDQATHNVQRTDHIGNHPLGERILIPAGMTNKGKELWIELTVLEVNSHEQELEVLKSLQRDDN